MRASPAPSPASTAAWPGEPVVLIQPHPGLRVEARTIGAEGAPLLVIDQAVADPDRLVRKAARGHFTPQGAMFPGLRIRAPLSYEVFLEQLLRPLPHEAPSQMGEAHEKWPSRFALFHGSTSR